MTHLLKTVLLLLVGALPVASVAQTGTEPPVVSREFRGVWVATVANIDWPSKPGLPVAQQKAELLAILDKSAELNLNAVVFQVRPAADALYASELEPWSAFLTGEQGKAPEPFYDPLEFAVEEAHQRGLELHAWFNPYRALHPAAKGELAETHLSKTHPELVKKYGRYLWMDPGEKGVQDHSLAVVLDIVKRYDVDGVHLDDYFYPYKEMGDDGKILDFPDEPSYTRYKESGGTLERDDWRRQNVDTFIRRLYEETKAAKPWVQVGLSPFGIWRPGNPPQIQGFDAYAELYADSRKWLQEGWCDYFTPQLYWPVGQTAQDYPTLQNWWIEQNTKHRHIWPGLFTSRVGDPGRNWDADVIKQQILATRAVEGATGNIHFSMKAIMQERPGLVPMLKELYAEPALVPASPWLDDTAPEKPEAKFETATRTLQLSATSDEPVARWVVQMKNGKKWTTKIVAATQLVGEDILRDGQKLATRQVRASSGKMNIPRGVSTVHVIAVDRFGNASEATDVAVK